MNGAGLRVRMARDVRNFEPAEWDRLLEPHEILSTHRFVRACQEGKIEDAEYWHLLIEDRGSPAALATLSRMTVSIDTLAGGLTRAAIRRLRSLSPSFLRVPVLFCGLPASFGAPGMRLARDADPARVLPIIVESMERVARERGVSLLCFKEFSPPAAELLGPLRNAGFMRAPSLPAYSMPIAWPTFDAYVGSLRAGYRRQIRQTVAARQSSGMSTRVLEGSADWVPIFYPLYEQVIDRAQFRLERLGLEFFERLRATLGDDCALVVIERNGKVSAAALMLFSVGTATHLLTGLDYRGSSLNGQLYPSLMAEVVAEAIRRGASRLELGQTSDRLKSRMGAGAQPRYIYVHHRNGLAQLMLRAASAVLFPTQPPPVRHVFRDR